MGKIIKKGSRFFNCESGFTLLEVMIAVGIFAIGITSLAALQYKTVGGNTRGRMITEATTYGERKMEELIRLPYGKDDDGGQLDPNANPHSFIPAAPYTVNWIVTKMDLDGDGTNDSKRIDLTVSAPKLQRAISMVFFKDDLN